MNNTAKNFDILATLFERST